MFAGFRSNKVYLLDTNTISYYLRGEGRVRTRILACRPGQLAMSSLSEFELWRGVLKARWSAARIHTLFEGLVHLPRLGFNSGEAQTAAQLATVLAAAGKTIGLMDCLIAGVALSNGATLVTRNRREFDRVPALQVEDWY